MSAIEQAKEQENPAVQFPALRPPRRYLFGPGPSMVHPRVYEALSKPIVGHLDPYFIQVMHDVQQLLKTVYGTKDGATLVISGTGSAGMEAAVTNFVEPGAKIAIFLRPFNGDGQAKRREHCAF
jgi:alanine-glyoxylate transaminase/serine-glyoxylate transaminase/serine-pyruvate transaminase